MEGTAHRVREFVCSRTNSTSVACHGSGRFRQVLRQVMGETNPTPSPLFENESMYRAVLDGTRRMDRVFLGGCVDRRFPCRCATMVEEEKNLVLLSGGEAESRACLCTVM